MTVCIAAIANYHKAPVIIAAADRMITIGDIEFEPEQTKAVYFATQTIGLLAGDMSVHAHCVPRVLSWVKQTTGSISVSDIANVYAREFSTYRRHIAEREILTPIGLDLNAIHTQDMAIETRAKLFSDLRERALGSVATIAGVDDTGAHIYVVGDPGVAHCFDTEGFAVTGLGAELARPQLMLARYHKRWEPFDAGFLVYSAKRRAEMVSSVGPQTDMFLVAPGQQPPIYQFQAADMKALSKIFDRQLARERRSTKKAANELSEYANRTQPAPKPRLATEQEPPMLQPSSEPTGDYGTSAATSSNDQT